MNMADNQSRELSIKVNVDISEALTGLKALQREAKKATQALRELEEAQNGVPEHVKNYGKHDRTYSTNSTAQAWFKDGDSE